MNNIVRIVQVAPNRHPHKRVVHGCEQKTTGNRIQPIDLKKLFVERKRKNGKNHAGIHIRPSCMFVRTEKVDNETHKDGKHRF